MKELKLIYFIYAFLVLLIGYQLIKFKKMTKKTHNKNKLTKKETQQKNKIQKHEKARKD